MMMRTRWRVIQDGQEDEEARWRGGAVMRRDPAAPWRAVLAGCIRATEARAACVRRPEIQDHARCPRPFAALSFCCRLGGSGSAATPYKPNPAPCGRNRARRQHDGARATATYPGALSVLRRPAPAGRRLQPRPRRPREAAGFLGQHLASWGYVAVHIQHPGSDESVWAGLTSRAEAIAAPGGGEGRARLDRPLQGRPFAVDRLEEMNAPGSALAGRLDMTRLGMSGHRSARSPR